MESVWINEFKLSPQESRLYLKNKSIELQPKCCSVLQLLVNRCGEVVSKQQLLDEIWKEQIVGDDVITSNMRRLRGYFNDNAKNPHVIETINKKGYRLIAKVKPVRNINPWLKPVNIMTVSLVSLALLFFLTHSSISIHTFTSKDSNIKTKEKMQQLVAEIEKGRVSGAPVKTLQYSFYNNSKNNIELKKGI